MSGGLKRFIRVQHQHRERARRGMRVRVISHSATRELGVHAPSLLIILVDASTTLPSVLLQPHAAREAKKMSVGMIPQPPVKVVSLEDAMVELADEGVPVRAIARATHTPSEDVYEVLKDAMGDGKLIELPQSDWPPGSLRRSRKQSGQSLLNMDDHTLRIACSKIFKMTRLQAAVFVSILRRPEITKDQVHTAIEGTRSPTSDPTDQKMIDVVICHIRKRITPHSIELKTIWGQGYALDHINRDKALALLGDYFQPQQAA